MASAVEKLAQTVIAMRPIVPARNFETSRRFYVELGFEPRPLAERLVEMRLGAIAFILQDHYVREWADNLVFHVTVSDVAQWWNHVVGLKLTERYGVTTSAPRSEGWAVVAGATDPSGVLWRFAELAASA